MDKAKEALQELLRLLADNPDLADRITITIKPNSKPSRVNAKRGLTPARGGRESSLPLSIKRKA